MKTEKEYNYNGKMYAPTRDKEILAAEVFRFSRVLAKKFADPKEILNCEEDLTMEFVLIFYEKVLPKKEFITAALSTYHYGCCRNRVSRGLRSKVSRWRDYGIMADGGILFEDILKAESEDTD